MSVVVDDSDVLDLSGGGSLIVIIGPSGTGKTHMTKFLVWLWYSKNMFDYYYAMSGTSFSGGLDFLGDQYKKDLTKENLIKFIACAKKMRGKGKKGLLILDDVGGTRGVFDSPQCRPLFNNFRHWGLTIVICCQKATQVPTDARTNAYIWMILNPNHYKPSIKVLMEEACLGDDKEFKKLLNVIHDRDNFHRVALVVDKKSVISDRCYIFFKAAADIPTFMIK